MTEVQANGQAGDMAYLGALDADTAMDVLFRGFAGIVDASPRLPSRVTLRFGAASVDVEFPEQQPAPGRPGAAEADPESIVDDRHQVTAPLVGTFYRAPQPGARPFAEVGDFVEEGQQVAIVEAMKLMNAIAADCSGRVVAILVEDGQPVEYGQPLLVLDTEDGQ